MISVGALRHVLADLKYRTETFLTKVVRIIQKGFSSKLAIALRDIGAFLYVRIIATHSIKRHLRTSSCSVTTDAIYEKKFVICAACGLKNKS